MTFACYLLGAPGTGKTTLMAALLEPYTLLPAVKLRGVLTGEPLVTATGRVAGVHLGRTRGTFSGTDALAMNVNPAAVAWASTATLPGVVLGEGARLGNRAFLAALAARATLTVIHLTADPALLDARCAARGSAQSLSWRGGAATRARNAAAVASQVGARVLELPAATPTAELAVLVAAEALP